jgi:hypothetical protein
MVGSAAAQKDYCFENDGLKDQHRVSLTITGNKIEGTFEVSGYDPNTSAETFDFTGTKRGNNLRIRFEGKPPYQLPRGTRQIIWMMASARLRIPTYGKNYQTGKYSAYTATYKKCKKDE